MTIRGAVMAGLGFAAVSGLLTGCRVVEHKDGDNKDVRIATPFGGMSVKTDEAGVQNGIGLDIYPGAVPEKKNKDDGGSADVNLSFGGFHLGVKAVSYTTPDAPDKVLAFYRAKMAKFGTVILCSQDRPVGSPTRTQDGLTCDKDRERTVHVDDLHIDRDKQELKAGSKQHQHIVEVEVRPTGTKIGLVMLDLPGKMSDDDADDKQ